MKGHVWTKYLEQPYFVTREKNNKETITRSEKETLLILAELLACPLSPYSLPMWLLFSLYGVIEPLHRCSGPCTYATIGMAC